MSVRRYVHLCAGVLCLALVFSVVAGGCSDNPVDEKSDNGNGDPPPPLTPPDSVSMTIRLGSWEDPAGPGVVQDMPGDVDEIRFEISASDMQKQTRTVSPAGGIVEETFRVKAGANRGIKVQAFDDMDALLYGSAAFVNALDTIMVAAVEMVAAGDVTPPAYSGLQDAAAISDTYVLLSWQPADDGETNDAAVSYLIYQSTVSGAFNYASPSHTTASGVTSHFVTELDPGATYYFVVRAMDRAGNVDANTAQMAVTMAPASGALYVDVTSGDDNVGCGTSGAPCKTISYALSKSTADQTIHVAKGTYNAASGETFPLQLKPGMSLLGEGYWWMGVKVIKETYVEGTTPVILGADNTSVVSCYVRPTGYGSSLHTVHDGGHAMSVYHCTVDGSLFPGVNGVSFGGASSVVETRFENLTGGAAVRAWGDGVRVRDNVALNCQYGVALSGSSAYVSGNVIKDVGSVGMTVGSPSGTLVNITVFRNYIKRCVGNGINISDVTDSKFSRNSISYTGGQGFFVTGQEPTHHVYIENNAITHGNSTAITILRGSATVIANTIVCNLSGVYLQTSEFVDLRYNAWDHDPPTINPGRGWADPGCDDFYDICYDRDYAGAPEPPYLPSSRGTCTIGIVPRVQQNGP